jgi:hypothetical protein
MQSMTMQRSMDDTLEATLDDTFDELLDDAAQIVVQNGREPKAFVIQHSRRHRGFGLMGVEEADEP